MEKQILDLFACHAKLARIVKLSENSWNDTWNVKSSLTNAEVACIGENLNIYANIKRGLFIKPMETITWFDIGISLSLAYIFMIVKNQIY